MMNAPSAFLVRTFTAWCAVTAGALPIGVYVSSRNLGADSKRLAKRAIITAVGMASWMVATFVAARSGALAFGPMPPRIALVVIPMIIGAVVLSRSSFGERLATGLPLVALVGVQAFRLPLELIMHRAYAEGVMPGVMSYSGRNFDIVTGASAIVVALLLAVHRMPIWGVRVWNWVGTLLLINVVVIAVLSMPTPMRVFNTDPPNVWITEAPFVWLPAVMVFYALLGHLLIFRRLRVESQR